MVHDDSPRGRYEVPGLLVLLACVVLVVYLPVLVGEHAPRGDGARIVPAAEAFVNSDSVYPLWNPWKLGGIPTLADPERYAWTSVLIEPGSAHVNFQVNLLLLGLLATFLALAWRFARCLGLETHGALFAVIVLANCFFVRNLVYAGRVNGFVNLIYILLAWLAYLAWVRGGARWALVAAAVLTGLLLAGFGHYTLVAYFPVLLLIGTVLRAEQVGWQRAVLRTSGEIVALVVSGMLAAAVLLLPLLGYQLSSHLEFDAISRIGDKLPIPASLPGLFFPFFYSDVDRVGELVFPYLSVAALPLCVLVCGIRQWSGPAPVVRVLGPWVLICLLVLLASLPGLHGLLRAIAEAPLVNKIRHTYAMYFAISLGGAVLLGWAYQRVAPWRHRGWSARVIPAFAVVACFAGGWLLAAGAVETHHARLYDWRHYLSYWAGLSGWKQAAGIALVVACCLPYTLLRRPATLRCYLAALLAFQVLCVDFPNFSRTVDNATPFPRIAAVLRDATGYFRVWDTAYRPQHELGLTGVRQLAGYSKYFAPEHRRTMAQLLGNPVRALRPTWMTRQLVAAPNERMLELANIRYVITRDVDLRRLGGVEASFLRSGWQQRARDGQYRLWEREGWRPALYVSAVHERVVDAEAAAQRAAALAPGDRTIVLESAPEIGTARQTTSPGRARIRVAGDDVMMIDVDSTTPALVYLSEYWDAGWTAEVDGRATPVLRANGAFRAVAVPQGSSTVVLRFAPPSVRAGAGISAVTLGLLIVFAVGLPGLRGGIGTGFHRRRMAGS